MGGVKRYLKWDGVNKSVFLVRKVGSYLTVARCFFVNNIHYYEQKFNVNFGSQRWPTFTFCT